MKAKDEKGIILKSCGKIVLVLSIFFLFSQIRNISTTNSSLNDKDSSVGNLFKAKASFNQPNSSVRAAVSGKLKVLKNAGQEVDVSIDPAADPAVESFGDNSTNSSVVSPDEAAVSATPAKDAAISKDEEKVSKGEVDNSAKNVQEDTLKVDNISGKEDTGAEIIK